MRYSYKVKNEIRYQLSHFSSFKAKLEIINEKLVEIQSSTGIHSIRSDVIPGTGNIKKESVWDKAIEFEQQLIEEKRVLSYTVANLERALAEVKINRNSNLIKCIEMRYFDNLSVETICSHLHIDKSTFYRYEDKAFEIIKVYMPI